MRTSRDDVRQLYRRFADRECKGHSDLYHRLALAVADDDDVVDFVAGMPVTQPLLFLASIQLLTGPDEMPRAAAELRAFVGRRGRELGDLMRSRRTQTNEVGRCAVLLPALPSGPLALVEVGASAGLCLLLDRFRYEYGSRHVGDLASPVRLRCAPVGPVPVPPAMPRVVWRRGLDLRPIDVRDPDATRWLLACVWADHPERRRRLEAAIELARAEPVAVTTGDLVDDLPAVLADAPEDARLVVFHSAVLSYLAPERRQAFVDVLAETSRRRDLVWLSNEAPGIVPGIPPPTSMPPELRFVLARTRLSDGRRRDEPLASSHPHGGEVIWF